MAEGARLESVYTFTGIGGSNPSLSAITSDEHHIIHILMRTAKGARHDPEARRSEGTSAPAAGTGDTCHCRDEEVIRMRNFCRQEFRKPVPFVGSGISCGTILLHDRKPGLGATVVTVSEPD